MKKQHPAEVPLVDNTVIYQHDRLKFLTRCAREYGDMVRCNGRLYIISEPSLIESILVNTHRQFTTPVSLIRRHGVKESIPDVMRKRQVAGRGLHRSLVHNHVPKMVHITEQVLRDWQEGQRIDVFKALDTITSQIMVDYCFGGDGESISSLVGELFGSLSPLINGTFSFPSWLPTPANRRVHRALSRLDGAIHSIIGKRRHDQLAHADLLGSLMDADLQGTRLSDEEVCQTLAPILLASYDVVTAALAWVWYLLAKHPESESSVHEEIDHVLGDRLPTADDLSKLKHVENVIKEALRLYPPAWLLSRTVAATCELGGHAFFRDQEVLFSPYVIQRDPRFFEQPDEFIPNRWQDEATMRSLPKYAYFPFGGGPRVCLGSALAMAELVLVTVLIARRFCLRYVGGMREPINPDRTLKPSHLEMMIMRRERASQEGPA